MGKRLFKLFNILKNLFLNPKYLILYVIRAEAYCMLKTFNKIGVGSTEDIQDLIFHIDSYIDLPNMLRRTVYEPYLKNGEKLDEYFEELEKARAVEREYIFELMKRLPIGFEF